MSKIRKTSAVFLAILTTIFIFGILYTLGIIIGKNTNLNYTVLLTFIYIFNILFILIVLVNIFKHHKYFIQVKNKKGEDWLSSILEKKEEVLKNIDNYSNKTINDYQKIYHATILFYTYQMLLLVFNGMAYKIFVQMNEYPLYGICFLFIIIMIIISFSIICSVFVALFTKLFTPKEKAVNNYPITYDFIKKIFLEEGITKEIKVNLIDDVNVGINQTNDIISIAIGTFILKFFTKDEISAIIYHEIAHYKNEDTKISEIIQKYLNILDILLPYDTCKLVCPKLVLTYLDNEILQQILSISHEIKADDAVLKKNIGQEYANCAVKLFGLSYAFKLYRADIEYALCKERQWTDEIIKKYFDGYLEFYNKNLDSFIFSSKHHLEARIQTHPNVRQRVEKFASKEINPIITISNEFDNDIKKFYDQANENLSKEIPENFNNFIKNYDEFLKNKSETIECNFNIDTLKLQSLMDLAYSYGDMEFAKDCANKVISLVENNSRAHLILGLILAFYEFSDECIVHLQSVYNDKNSQLFLDGFDALAEYVSISGKEELRNSLREEVATIYDTNKEIDEVLNLKFNDHLKEFSNLKVIDNIIKIASECEDIQQIGIGTKCIGNSHCHHVILFIKNKDKDKIKETNKKIWAYLDLEEDQYNLIQIPISAIPATHKFRKKPLCVYKR